MEGAHYWYYMLELGFYGSLLLRISVDVKRKVRSSAAKASVTLLVHRCSLGKWTCEKFFHILYPFTLRSLLPECETSLNDHRIVFALPGF